MCAVVKAARVGADRVFLVPLGADLRTVRVPALPQAAARRLRRVSGVFRSSPSPAAGARLPALGLEPAAPAPPPRPRLRPRWVLTFPGERGLPSQSVSTSCTRMWTSIVRKAVSATAGRIQKEGAERVRLKEKGRGRGRGREAQDREAGVWGSQPGLQQPGGSGTRSPESALVHSFLCGRRSPGCNIGVPCPRRNSDFLKPAKCPEPASFTR